MRDRAVSLTLYGTLAHVNGAEDAPTGPPIGSPDLLHHPSVFLLLSFSATRNQAVHTHEDRAFVLQTCRGILETRSLHTVNLGPAFRAQYGSFSSESPLPWMPCQRGFEDGNKREGESSNHLGQFAREQQMLELSAEDFSVERLGRLVGPVASQYTSELEDLYGRRLLKLESLARLVEESSAKILVQGDDGCLEVSVAAAGAAGGDGAGCRRRGLPKALWRCEEVNGAGTRNISAEEGTEAKIGVARPVMWAAARKGRVWGASTGGSGGDGIRRGMLATAQRLRREEEESNGSSCRRRPVKAGDDPGKHLASLVEENSVKVLEQTVMVGSGPASSDAGSEMMPLEAKAQANVQPMAGFLHDNYTGSLQITLHKLNGKNYLEWSQTVRLAIDGKGKLGYLNG
ncbi:hypothetical protein ZIOFF_035944 [Zingiber officinale]|uniref:Retrotransposon Copia-like N-terminal domain-containing protein n=1 Tax=Zingiber officinale TaxID=94328 RepID=A0A8J5GPE6_ZINOF|nr:hypothetical protein ZIOFF_035944 [Zingiber officinale]